MTRAEKHSASRAGFTLLEMLVALVAGSIAITSIYFVSASSSRHFQEQQRIAQTQQSIRMSMEQLRRDIARAGYLGTPNSGREQTCASVPTAVRAMEMRNAADSAVLPEASRNGVEADRLYLTGNFVTADSYLIIGLNGAGNGVFLQRNWQSFRRSFGSVDTSGSWVYEPGAFDDVFMPGRMLHIQTVQGMHFFVRISARNSAQATVAFTPALPVGGHCVVGLADSAMVSPLSRIEYRVMNVGGADIGSVSSGSTVAGVNGPVLVRREVQFDRDDAIAGTERVVAEHVADFDVDFIFEEGGTGAPSVLRRRGDAVAAARLVATATPHAVRSAIVRLSVRTPMEEPQFLYEARGAGAPLTRYDINTTTPGAARVRTITSEIIMPNVANRGMRP